MATSTSAETVMSAIKADYAARPTDYDRAEEKEAIRTHKNLFKRMSWQRKKTLRKDETLELRLLENEARRFQSYL